MFSSLLAAAVGYSERQLNRHLLEEYGAGAAALARSRRAQAARSLLVSTDLPLADIAFAAGFGSVRQFNDTIRSVYAVTPSALRDDHAATTTGTAISVRLAVREPFDGAGLYRFLAVRAVPGVEAAAAGLFERTLRLPSGPGVMRIHLVERPVGSVPVELNLADLRDLTPALSRARRLIDADCDPTAVDEQLQEDPALAGSVRRRPGLRVPGHVDGAEMAFRAVIGQQVSVAAARTVAARLAAAHGEIVEQVGPHGGPRTVNRLFPTAARLAELSAADFPMPRARGNAMRTLAAALSDREVRLDHSRSRDQERASLLAVPGIGPWTTDYILMRALGDPDVLLPTDLGVRRGAAALGIDDLVRRAERWRPWRSYAMLHLWSALDDLDDDGLA